MTEASLISDQRRLVILNATGTISSTKESKKGDNPGTEMTDTPTRESNGIRLVSADKDDFVPSSGLNSMQAGELLKVHGPNELPEKKIPKWYVFLSLFWQPMPIMIWIGNHQHHSMSIFFIYFHQ